MAARFFIGGGTNTNWNASPTTNWCATSGGTVRVAAPTSADDVTFDGAGTNGNTASVISGSASCLTFTMTSGYTNTITRTFGLTVAGNFTDGANGSWAGTGGLTINAASTITPNGKTWSNSVILSNANTKTLAGDWTVGGNITITGGTQVLNGNTLNLNGDLYPNSQISGTTTINWKGTNASATWVGSSVVQNNFNFASGGTFIIFGSITYNTGTITNNGATSVDTTGSNWNIDANTTINTAGITWNNVSIRFTLTMTLNSLLSISGILSISAGIDVTFAGTTGFTVGTLSDPTTSVHNRILKNGITYIITASLQCNESRKSSAVLFKSDSAGVLATLILRYGATCNCLASFTDITAAGGRPIHTFNGTLSNTTNIVSYQDVLIYPPAQSRLGRRRKLYNRAFSVQYE